jgi:hypothetical protein
MPIKFNFVFLALPQPGVILNGIWAAIKDTTLVTATAFIYLLVNTLISVSFRVHKFSRAG